MLFDMDEGRTRVLLIAASILAARKMVNWDGPTLAGFGDGHTLCPESAIFNALQESRSDMTD